MTTQIYYIWSFIVMMTVNCPQYNNMSACLAMFNQIPEYYYDYRGFRQAPTAPEGSRQR